MRVEVVHHHEVALPQVRAEHLLDEDQEGVRVAGPFQLHRAENALGVHGSHQAQVRRRVAWDHPVGAFSLGRTGIAPGHVGVYARLVHEDGASVGHLLDEITEALAFLLVSFQGAESLFFSPAPGG